MPRFTNANAQRDLDNAARQLVVDLRWTSQMAANSVETVKMVFVNTSPFGYRLHPVLGVYKLHNGTDFAAACGTPVHPIAPGVVIATNVETAGGNVAYVNHGMINGSSWVSAYVHMVGFNVSVGQHVDTSSVVGYVGSTGYATGCHLHLTIEQNGNLVDPQKFL